MPIPIATEHEGDPTCEHAWRDESFNDWGFPYFVVCCKRCARKLSHPSMDLPAIYVYRTATCPKS